MYPPAQPRMYHRREIFAAIVEKTMPAGPTLFFLPSDSHDEDHGETEDRVQIIEQHIVDDEEYGDPSTIHDMYCRNAHVTSITDREDETYVGTLCDFGGFRV